MEFEISEGRDMQEPVTGGKGRDQDGGPNADPEEYAAEHDRAIHIPEQEDA